jgi:hypothetical protein
MVVGGNQSGKGAKGLLMGKAAAVPVVDDKKDKKKPTSRSSRAGLQVRSLSTSLGSAGIGGPPSGPVSVCHSGFLALPLAGAVYCPVLFVGVVRGDVASTALNVGWSGLGHVSFCVVRRYAA